MIQKYAVCMKYTLLGIFFSFILSWFLAMPYQHKIALAETNGFTIVDGVLTKYTGNDTEVEIPSTVTKIGCQAFANRTSIISIHIPSSVTSIDKYAFSKCTSLTNINIPSSVTSINNYAFYQCTSLISINIPSSVTIIGTGAFSKCTSLTSINIPSSITSINCSVFFLCTSLSNIDLPTSITIIDSSAFYGCTSLTTIEIPDSVTIIGDNAFCGCSNLSLIDIPTSVDEVYISSFLSTPWLEQQKLRSPFVIINGILVDGTSCVGNVTIPSTVTIIGREAFAYNNLVTGITISKSVTTINACAFYSCAFYSCAKLTYITMANSITSMGSECCSYCYKLESVTLSDALTTIPLSTFEECKKLKAIVIPAKVIEIEDGAFRDCKKLKSVTISDKVSFIGDLAFDNCNSNLTFYGISNSYAKKYANKKNIAFKKLALEKTTIYLSRGKKVILIFNSGAIGSYSTSNKSIAKVNSKGKITGVKNGNATITAIIYEAKYKCRVTVK